MAYCLVTDVEALNAGRTDLYSTTSNPTEAQVQGFINQIAADIDAVLSASGIVVPVSPSNDFLKFLNTMGAAALAEAAIALRGGGTDEGPRNWRWDTYQKRLDLLMVNPALSGGTSASSTAADYARSDYTSNYTTAPTEFKNDGGNW